MTNSGKYDIFYSKVSDGRKTPDALKKYCLAHGYHRIIAYTDHERPVRRNDLTDDTFLALNGYGVGVTINEASFRVKEGERRFRLVVVDREGCKAYTNAYFPDTF